MKHYYSITRLCLLLLFFTGANIAYSQVTVNVDTPPNLVNNVLIGNGVLVSGITSQGAPNQFASFTAAPGTPIDFDYGVVLSTFNMATPNCLQVGGPGYVGAGTAGDADLSATSGTVTNNAAWIQFDFVPTGDTMKFDYIFGSTEYNFYVNSFNDVFAFYLTGPNPVGPAYASTNVAVVPMTATPVTINNVNNGQSAGCATGPCTNCAYYVDNCVPPANGLQTGGYTTNLQVVVPVVPCSTYTIKLGVADAIDGALNSFVMLKANSFISNQVTISSESNLTGIDTLTYNDSVVYEGCTFSTLNFIRSGDITLRDSVVMTISGTAVNGVDYNHIDNYVIFDPMEDTVQVIIDPILDGFLEPLESITINIVDTICGNPSITTITVYVSDVDSSLSFTAGNDTMFCDGALMHFDAEIEGGANIYNIHWWNPVDSAFEDDSTFVVNIEGYYLARGYEYCLDSVVYDSIYIHTINPPTPNIPNIQACSGQPINIGIPPIPGYDFIWSPPTNLDDPTLSNPEFTGVNLSATPVNYNYTITLDTNGYQCYSDNMTVTLYRIPVVDIGDSLEGCEGISIILNAGNPGLNYVWNTSQTSQAINVTNGGLYYVTVSVPGTSCSASDSAYITIYPRYTTGIPNQQLCSGDSIGIGLTAVPGANYTWTPSTNLNNGNISNPVFTGNNTSGSPTTFTYYLAIDSAGHACTFDTVTIVLNPNPDLNMPDTAVFCENSYVALNAGIPGATYAWNTGQNTQSINADSVGLYIVTVTYPTTCNSSDSTMVTIDSLPHFDVPDQVVCEGDSAVLAVDPGEGDSFLWSTFETTPSIYTFTPGFYTLTVENSCGSTTDTAQVIFKPNLTNVPLPNMLTPNGDGLNDVYDIPVLAEAEDFRMDFFDRWGVLLFTTTDVNNPWTGQTSDGSVTYPNGTYYVVLQLLNCKGETIKRTEFITLMKSN